VRVPVPHRVDVGLVRASNHKSTYFGCCLGTGFSGRVSWESRRIRRLQGVINFVLRTEYDDRLNKFNRHLAELSAAIKVLNARYESFVRTRQAAVHSYEGYDTPIARLRTHVSGSLAKVNQLLARQGHIIELVAIDVLTARRERLAEYQDQARYALADSYDRATKARVDGKTAALAPSGRPE